MRSCTSISVTTTTIAVTAPTPPNLPARSSTSSHVSRRLLHFASSHAVDLEEGVDKHGDDQRIPLQQMRHNDLRRSAVGVKILPLEFIGVLPWRGGVQSRLQLLIQPIDQRHFHLEELFMDRQCGESDLDGQEGTVVGAVASEIVMSLGKWKIMRQTQTPLMHETEVEVGPGTAVLFGCQRVVVCCHGQIIQRDFFRICTLRVDRRCVISLLAILHS
mmetsp:Transcript_18298/g.50790  ORF Transcript_18298/g.50790 Transcript_18298/m.50790 type:complete len:217 (-) Transcript_18298:253-903(-)